MVHLNSLRALNYFLIDVATLQPADAKSMDDLTDILAVPEEHMESVSPFLKGLKGLR